METKFCSGCNNELPVDKFNWKNKPKGQLYHVCKVCWNKQNKLRYENNKQYYIEKAEKRKRDFRLKVRKMKSEAGCSRCPENHPACLHFHHRDPSKKLFEVCDALLTRSWDKVSAEIEKCDILCANCHAKLHDAPGV